MLPSPILPDLAHALPDRPITVRPPDTMGPKSSVGIFVLLFGLLAGALAWLGPDLVRDWRIGGEVVEARGGRIEQARCRSRLVLVTVCDIAFVDERAAAPTRETLWYFFIDTAGREPIVLVRPKAATGADATAITTNLGLDKFYHRLLALVLIVGLLLFCIALSAQVVFQGHATRAALARLSGRRLTPVIVTLESKIPIAHKRRRWTYLWDSDGGRQERAFIELSTRSDPLYVTPDGKRALALAGPDGGVPLLLDASLSALDLSEAEKEAFFAACRSALGAQPAP
jgi:hypothetical protein